MAVRFSRPNEAPNIAAAGSAAADRVSGLFNDFVGGYGATQGLLEQNQIRNARQSLADLGATPDGGLDYGAAANRLLAAGDIRGAQALADLGLAQEDRAFRRERAAAEDNYRQQSLGLQRDQFNARPPDTTTMYDPETGAPQTGAWNPQTRTYEPVGGTKAPAAPATTTVYDPETGQPQTAVFNPQTKSFDPIGGVKKPAPKPIPVAVQNAEAGDLQDVQTLSQVNDMLGRYSTAIDTGALSLGGLENLQSRFQNWTGNSTDNSRNFASFMADMEKMRNETLRLNKGVQTEGDAERAWNEIFANINDPKVVRQRLEEIQRYNQAAAQFKVNQIGLRRSMNQLDPLDTSTIVTPSVPGKDNDRAPSGTAQERAASGQPPRITTQAQYQALKPGDTYTAPDGSVRVKR